MGLFDVMKAGLVSAIESEQDRRQHERQIEGQEQRATSAERDFAEKHQAFIEREMEAYENDRASREVTRRMYESDKGNGFFDFTVFDDLKPEFRDRAVSNLRIVLYGRYKTEMLGVLDETSAETVDIASINLKNFEYFPEFREMVSRTTRHFDFFINDDCLKSMLEMPFNAEGPEDGELRIPTPDEIARALEDNGDPEDVTNILHWATAIRAIDDIDLLNWYPLRSKYPKLIINMADATDTKLQPSVEELLSGNDIVDENVIRAADILLGADREESHYMMIKLALLRSALRDADHEALTATYDFLKSAAELLMGVFVSWESNGETTGAVAVPVDVVFAEAIRLNKANMIDEINSYLAEQLEIYAHASFDTKWQFTLMANFFAALRAFKQELMVLECMVSNNIARTEQQEARLSFLRSGGAVAGAAMANRIAVDFKEEQGKLAIDYRVLSWSESQIAALYDLASGNNELQRTPLVVAEWSKNIPTPSIHWDNEEVALMVRECIAENFGEALKTEAVQAGIIMDGDLDYSDAIIIEPTDGAKYPWLGFVLSGDQLTQKQVALSLFAVYWPDRDFIDEPSTIQRNTKAVNRTTMLKLGQNPKVNNYIGTIESLLIDALEEYFNRGAVEEIY